MDSSIQRRVARDASPEPTQLNRSHSQHLPGPYPPRPSAPRSTSYERPMLFSSTPPALPALRRLPVPIESPRSEQHQSPIPPSEMSSYSSSSADGSNYNFPMPRQYQVMSTFSNPPQVNQAQLNTIVQALNTHRINTITDLRRVEKILTNITDPVAIQSMISAWVYYVDSNNLLSEIRGLTRTYTFSSECLDHAKHLVVNDPNSSWSRNYCFLVLCKIRDERLIPRYARLLANSPSMWGGRQPSQQQIEQLARNCIVEWMRVLRLMLRHWE